MKYNKSEIMKRAWELVKMSHEKQYAGRGVSGIGTFKAPEIRNISECLKQAWSEAKEAAAKAEELNALSNSIARGTFDHNGHNYLLSLWTNYGKARVYVKRDGQDMGYVDIQTGENCCRRLDNDLAGMIVKTYKSRVIEALDNQIA